MPLDEILTKAVSSAVEQFGQPHAVASRLVAWLEAMSTTDVSAEEESRFLENARNAVQIQTHGELE
jgi:hypothetical protein